MKRFSKMFFVGLFTFLSACAANRVSAQISEADLQDLVGVGSGEILKKAMQADGLIGIRFKAIDESIDEVKKDISGLNTRIGGVESQVTENGKLLRQLLEQGMHAHSADIGTGTPIPVAPPSISPDSAMSKGGKEAASSSGPTADEIAMKVAIMMKGSENPEIMRQLWMKRFHFVHQWMARWADNQGWDYQNWTGQTFPSWIADEDLVRKEVTGGFKSWPELGVKTRYFIRNHNGMVKLHFKVERHQSLGSENLGLDISAMELSRMAAQPENPWTSKKAVQQDVVPTSTAQPVQQIAIHVHGDVMESVDKNGFKRIGVIPGTEGKPVKTINVLADRIRPVSQPDCATGTCPNN